MFPLNVSIDRKNQPTMNHTRTINQPTGQRTLSQQALRSGRPLGAKAAVQTGGSVGYGSALGEVGQICGRIHMFERNTLFAQNKLPSVLRHFGLPVGLPFLLYLPGWPHLKRAALLYSPGSSRPTSQGRGKKVFRLFIF